MFQNRNMTYVVPMRKKLFLLASFFIPVACSFAQTATEAATAVAEAEPDPLRGLRWFLMGVAIALLFAAILMETAIRTLTRAKKEEPGIFKRSLVTTLLMLIAVNGFSQTAAPLAKTTAAVAPKLFMPTDIWLLMIAVVGLWIWVVSQARILFRLLEVREKRREARVVRAAREGRTVKTFKQFITGENTAEELEQKDLHHEYDGIRELDNNIPGWWRLAFNFTILFGIVYLFRMFINHSMPTQEEELAKENEVATIAKTLYLKNSANNIDENNVTLADAAGITAGAELFKVNCAACHANDGGGTIGPNLTDDYWLHGGGIKDIFATIKYGVVEKGMRSWKEDLSPQQIQNVASYIQSIHGAKTASPKEPQGELYTRDSAAAAAPVTDPAAKTP